MKLAGIAEKFSALHSTEPIFFGGEPPKTSGTYIAFTEKTAPDDARLIELAKELTDVKQPIFLDLKECKKLKSAGLAPFAALKCITALFLKGTDLKKLLPIVAKATQLQYLLLVDDSLVDTDLAPIAGLVELRGLIVGGTLTAASYRYLANMTELEIISGSLAPQYLNFGDEDLAHVAKLAKLKKFQVSSGPDGKLTDRGLESLKGMSSLEKLSVKLTPGMTSKSLTLLAGLKNLQELDVYDESKKTWLWTDLEKLQPLASHLKSMRLSNSLTSSAPPSGSWVSSIAKFKGLTRLELHRAGLTDADLSNLSGLSNLKSLDLSGNRITGPGLAHLKPLVKLDDLDLKHTGLSDAAAAAIEELPPSVQSINLRVTKISTPVLDKLEKSRKWRNFFR